MIHAQNNGDFVFTSPLENDDSTYNTCLINEKNDDDKTQQQQHDPV